MRHSLQSEFVAAPPPALSSRVPKGTAIPPAQRASEQEPLSLIVREIARELEADGVLVALHRPAESPICLFFDGMDATENAFERSIIETAAEAADAGERTTISKWHVAKSGPDELLLISLPVDGAVVTIASLFRRIKLADKLRARESVARLLPLLQPFFSLYALRDEALSRERGMAAAMNSCELAALVVNRRCDVLYANDSAEALLSRADGLRRSGRTVSCARFADTLRLHASIEHVVGRGSLSGSEIPVLAVQRKDRRSLMAAIAPAEGLLPDDTGGIAIIYAFDPDQETHVSVEPVCKLYGLSPVETKLACLLADGDSLVEAALKIRIREQTARSYLKQIFLKTDTNRQAELVCLLLRSAVRTSPKLNASFI